MKIEFFGTGGGGGSETTISLSTNNTSGASTLSGAGALNIPIYSDTNLNIGNTNLISSGVSRTFKVGGGGNLKLQTNAGLNTLEVNDNNFVVIGNTNSYALPNARGTAEQQLIADGSTLAEWKTNILTTKYQSQTPAGRGTAKAEMRTTEHYFPDNENGSMIVGISTGAATIDDIKLASITQPFRCINTGSQSINEGNDTMIVQFTATFATTYNIFIARVNHIDGTPLNGSGISLTNIGTFVLSLTEVNKWYTKEFALTSVQDVSNSSYYVCVQPTQVAIGLMSITMCCTYNNPDTILSTLT